MTNRLVNMPRSSEQFAEMRHESRKAIKQAALELFASHGYHATSISSIASHAGISKGLLYNYYSSKDDLLKDILSEATTIGDDIFMNAVNKSNNDPMALLEIMIDTVFAFMENNQEYMKLLFSLSMKKDITDKFEEILGQTPQKKLDFIVSHLDRIGISNAKYEALYIGALLDGISLQYIHLQPDYPLHEMKSFIKRKILNHLKN